MLIKNIKISFTNIHKHTTHSIWYSLIPSFEKRWMGQLILIGTNGFYFTLDFRGINSMQDFADALQYPKIWHILKKIKP